LLDSGDDRLWVLFRLDERVSSSQLPEEMGIGGAHQGKAILFCLLHGPGIEIDPVVVEMGELNGIKDFDVLIQVGMKGMGAGEVGMGSDDQAALLPATLQVGEAPYLFRRPLGLDDQDMMVFDPGLRSWDEENATPLRMIPQFLGVGNRFMIGNGEDLETPLLGLVDQPLGGVGDGIVGVFPGVKMKIGLQGRRGLYFNPPCFTQT